VASNSSDQAPGQIVIVRHGEPDADRYERLDWRGYERWWMAYDEAGLKPGQTPPEDLLFQASHAETCFASTLPRAIETARSCIGSKDLNIDSQFVEAALPPPQVPGKFQARTWGVLARCSWWMGHARGRETRGQAEARASQVAQTLIEASQNGPVILFAHGWFNRMVRPHLGKQGWQCVHDGGDWYWSWRRYELKKRS
jgi:broad specificity phosphatase PhoE